MMFVPFEWASKFCRYLERSRKRPVLCEEWLKEYSEAIKLNKDLIMVFLFHWSGSRMFLNHGEIKPTKYSHESGDC